jgi:20S proteasome alpha/beta subunit
MFIGFVYSGMGPDFRVLTRNARKAAQKYFLTYREVQPLAEVVRESALVMQEYTQSGMSLLKILTDSLIFSKYVFLFFL